MNKKSILISFTIIFGCILVLYRHWFITHEIIGGDWPYYFVETVKSMSFPPPAWVFWQNNGLGGLDAVRGLHTFESFLAVVGTQWLKLPWSVVYKFGWFGLFLLCSFISSSLLWRRVFPNTVSSWFPALAGLIYTTNTYIFMVTGGGQMGVALAYALAPLVLATFLPSPPAGGPNIKYVLIIGLLFGFQFMIDPRIAYVTLVVVGLFFVFILVRSFLDRNRNYLRFLFLVTLRLSISLVIALLLNAFWFIPMITMRFNPLSVSPDALTSVASLNFFSFSDYSHALSLLHPNWPENIFGKTYFLQPEFLLLPFLAFSALLYSERNRRTIYFFSFLALLGAFLSKGTQGLFGSIYPWLFVHVPGFVMFRDPTKFYLLIAISYSILIPYTLERLSTIGRKGRLVVIAGFVIFWLFTIREAVTGQLQGTFAQHVVPQDYIKLKDFLVLQPEFSRTLWVPRQQRYAYSSSLHPAVEAQPLFSATTSSELIAVLKADTAYERLAMYSIRYIVVPSDPLREMYVRNRMYDDALRQSFEDTLDEISWIKKIPMNEISLYETKK